MKLKSILSSVFVVWLGLTSFMASAQMDSVKVEVSAVLERVEQIKEKPVVMSEQYRGGIKSALMSDSLVLSEIDDKLFMSIFHEILASQNYGLIDKGDILIIVPTNQMRNLTTLILKEGDEGKMFGTAVIKSEKIPVNDIIAILRPILSKYGHIAPEKVTNSIVVVDHADNVERFRKLVKALNSK